LEAATQRLKVLKSEERSLVKRRQCPDLIDLLGKGSIE
jgi:hypothetical protein